MDLVKAVRDYAMAHYDAGKGWDYVVEAWGDSDILKEVAGCTTEAQAIKAVGKVVRSVADYAAEVRATEF